MAPSSANPGTSAIRVTVRLLSGTSLHLPDAGRRKEAMRPCAAITIPGWPERHVTDPAEGDNFPVWSPSAANASAAFSFPAGVQETSAADPFSSESSDRPLSPSFHLRSRSSYLLSNLPTAEILAGDAEWVGEGTGAAAAGAAAAAAASAEAAVASPKPSQVTDNDLSAVAQAVGLEAVKVELFSGSSLRTSLGVARVPLDAALRQPGTPIRGRYNVLRFVRGARRRRLAHAGFVTVSVCIEASEKRPSPDGEASGRVEEDCTRPHAAHEVLTEGFQQEDDCEVYCEDDASTTATEDYFDEVDFTFPTRSNSCCSSLSSPPPPSPLPRFGSLQAPPPPPLELDPNWSTCDLPSAAPSLLWRSSSHPASGATVFLNRGFVVLHDGADDWMHPEREAGRLGASRSANGSGGGGGRGCRVREREIVSEMDGGDTWKHSCLDDQVRTDSPAAFREDDGVWSLTGAEHPAEEDHRSAREGGRLGANRGEARVSGEMVACDIGAALSTGALCAAPPPRVQEEERAGSGSRRIARAAVHHSFGNLSFCDWAKEDGTISASVDGDPLNVDGTCGTAEPNPQAPAAPSDLGVKEYEEWTPMRTATDGHTELVKEEGPTHEPTLQRQKSFHISSAAGPTAAATAAAAATNPDLAPGKSRTQARAERRAERRALARRDGDGVAAAVCDSGLPADASLRIRGDASAAQGGASEDSHDETCVMTRLEDGTEPTECGLEAEASQQSLQRQGQGPRRNAAAGGARVVMGDGEEQAVHSLPGEDRLVAPCDGAQPHAPLGAQFLEHLRALELSWCSLCTVASLVM